MILTDNETKVDFLNNEAIAKTIVRLLRDRPDRPITIGVHGDWGAGKSSILEMIEAGLDGHENVLCLKFNGWRFQGFEDAKIALIEGIVTSLLEKRPALTKAAGVVRNVFQRIDWLKVAKKAGGLALTTLTGIPSPDQIHTIVKTLEGLLHDPTKFADKVNVETAIDGVQSLLRPADETKNVPQEIGAFRKAFDDLLEEAKVEQLVVLIDDLDRCLPDTAIETLEAVRLFVFTSRTAFVVAADEGMIEYAVRKHFPELPDTTGPRDYAKSYLEKLIQVPFRIPNLGESETRIYVSLLLIGAQLGDDDADFVKLLDLARERLKRPWKGGTLDAASVKDALGDNAEKVGEALTLSDQIGPILASGTRGNPRQIKRFLNTLLLRHRTAEARGFGNDVKVPVLAKLMLAERYMTRLFDQIATAAASDSNGRCKDLAALEAAPREGETASVPATKPARSRTASEVTVPPRPESTTPQDSVLLTEWLKTNQIIAWARVAPSLATTDLRPYLFVTKDRKDYFGAASVLGHLATVVEQLFGPEMAVRAMEQDLKRLSPPEAAQVFDTISTRIIGADKFDTEPDGIHGLAILARACPTLQSSMLTFLERLPPAKLGVWALSGWADVFKDAEIQERFNALVKRWGTSGNAMLKVAVATMSKLPQRAH